MANNNATTIATSFFFVEPTHFGVESTVTCRKTFNAIMGNCCNGLSYEQLERQEILKEGAVFSQKTKIMGIATGVETLKMNLTPNLKTLHWKILNGKTSKKGEIHLRDIAWINYKDSHDISIFSKKGVVLMELEIDSENLRNVWVQTLKEMIDEHSTDKETGGTSAALEAKKRSFNNQDKEEYWQKRSEQIDARKKEAEEKKKKFANVGLKYTAQAMAKRV